ncbi:hypothetical protein D3C77_600870 [compost metagenome]
MEEAARLFYVGMTRAKTQLEMLTYQQREGEKTTESAFLTEVRAILNPPQLRVTLNSERQTYSGSRAGASSGGTATGTAAYTVPIAAAAPAPSFNANTIRALVDLAPGMQVVHLAFGLGKVTNISGPTDLIEIQFAAGVKRLSVRTCLDMGLLEVPEPVEILK